MKGRQRGRNNGGKPRMHHQGGGGGGRNPSFDVGRMRGNAQQLLDKYMALGRDASMQGDRVLAENYFQHADHYYRVVNARFEGQQQNQHQQRHFNGPRHQGGYEGQDGQEPLNDFGRSDIPPGPSQNLIPSGGEQPQAAQQQPQQNFDPMYQPQPQAAPQQQQQPEGEIGLPPQLFGGQQPQGQPAPDGQQNNANRGNGDGNFRPRHQGRRRFGGRPNQNQSPPEAP